MTRESVIDDTGSGADATDPFADVAFDDTAPDTAADTSVDTAVEPDTLDDTSVDTAIEPDTLDDTSVDTTAEPDTLDDTSVDDTTDTTDTTVEPDTTPVCRPEPAWTRSPRRAGGAAVFNELGVTPTGGDAGAAWIEITNQQALDLDMSGWRIAGSATYTFPEGSMLLGGQQLVVAVATLAPATFGPLAGRLPASGGQLELRNNADRIMDAMVWTASTPWPVISAGYTLAKKERDSWSALAENWAPSDQVGGTPGAP
ncbi:MAG: lamin tail domain-containing protein, partial [Actinobacteria bacterium]|nr:lamin tail domain-containing protein [Actinomycetota bacterium]